MTGRILPVQAQPSNSYLVTIVPATPTEATGMTVTDLFLGSFGMAGLMVLLALVLGVVLAGVRVVLRRFVPPTTDHMPRLSAMEPDSPVLPPSSQPR